MTTLTERVDDRRPSLDLNAPVLDRPGGRVQIGWSPASAVVVDAAQSGRVTDLASLLRAMDGVHTVAQLHPIARRAGLDSVHLTELITELGRHRLIRWVRPPGSARTHVAVLHGRGSLGDQVAASLGAAGIEVHRSAGRHVEMSGCGRPDVVLLVETLVPDPGLLAELVAERIPHLPVRLRDGAALVGPLVLPGRTSCVRCTDHHRADADPGWPGLAAQLMQRTGGGSPAGVRAAGGAGGGAGRAPAPRRSRRRGSTRQPGGDPGARSGGRHPGATRLAPASRVRVRRPPLRRRRLRRNRSSGMMAQWPTYPAAVPHAPRGSRACPWVSPGARPWAGASVSPGRPASR